MKVSDHIVGPSLTCCSKTVGPSLILLNNMIGPSLTCWICVFPCRHLFVCVTVYTFAMCVVFSKLQKCSACSLFVCNSSHKLQARFDLIDKHLRNCTIQVSLICQQIYVKMILSGQLDVVSSWFQRVLLKL